MKIFNKYANYYDQLYQDKDYQGEANFIGLLIKKYSKGKHILEMGCGTGIHACLLAKKGFRIKAIDISKEMIKIAEDRKQKELSPKQSKFVSFTYGNLINFRDSEKHDVVISLFHIFSYITNTNDINSALDNIWNNLKTNGVLIFDFWYGPSVLTQQPSLRVKEVNTVGQKLIRIATPKLVENENCVQVNYHLVVEDKKTNKFKEIQEVHNMRYFFLPEIKLLLQQNKFEFIDAKEWLTNKNPSINSWGVYIIAKKKP